MNGKKLKFISKVICLVLCLCFVTTMFSSCKKDKSTTIKLPLSVLPASFDPQIATGIDSESILNNCFEGLVRIDSSGHIAKGVAESWDISSDGLTYTFNLRGNAKWHLPKKLDGILGENYEDTFDTSVTAYDFEFALKRAVDPATKAPLANTLSAISGAESILSGQASPDTLSVYAENDTTLKIKLSRPSVTFLSVLASPVSMPCNREFFEATAGRYGLETNLVLCNGPYYIGNSDPEIGVTIYSNDSYAGEYAPIAQTAKFLFPQSMVKNKNPDNNTSESSSTEAVKTIDSNVDLLTADGGFDAGIVSYQDMRKLDASDFTVTKYKNTVKAICFNSTSDKLLNKNIRLAMAHSTDISLLYGSNLKAEGIVPACCGLAPGVSYRAGSNIIYPPKFDAGKALAYISKAAEEISGEENATLPEFSVRFICLKEDEIKIKEMLQNWQKAFGVSLSVSLETFDTQERLNNEVKKGSYDVAFTTLTASEFLAADFLNNFCSASGTNILNLSSSEYDRLMQNVYVAPDEAALLAANKAAEQYLVSGGFILPVCQYDSYFAVKNTAKGLTVRPSGTVYALYE